MNIGLFSETYYPEINGVATSVYMLKNELEKRGHNVYVFTTTTPGAPEYEHNVFRVPSMPFIFITERRVGLFYQPKLAHVIKKLNLDIIHTHTEFSLGIFGRIMAKELRLPVVHTYHTIYEDYTHYITHFEALDRRAKAFARTYTKVCCNTVEQVVVPTEKTRKLLMTYSVHKDISVVPTGIDLSKFEQSKYSREEIEQLKQSYGIHPDDKVMLYLGRVSQEKNIGEIIAAMPEYMARRERVKFVIVGSGPALEKLQGMVNELGLSDRFVFTGARPWDTIGLYYRLGDVFVSASKSETQGLTYIEAMASGLPVVAREDNCLEDILEQGVNGYAFTDAEGLYYGLDQVLFEDKTTNYGENAVDKVKKYSLEEFACQIETVYQQVISRDRVFCKRPVYDTKRIKHFGIK
ncbi:MAG: 1,2-diacylglycerol 3-glucosyltransferase [Herbinix sp.]|jgi:1,2-diacylglycerol 3-alpha-glucosyltransferase|nr:1,2-diacylglycerol 3-glucosyltransferase [Herbinix sp.]